MRSAALVLLRACPNATAGPSRIPAVKLGDGWHPCSSAFVSQQSPVHVLPIRRYASSAPADKSSKPPGSCPANPHPHPAFDRLADHLVATQPCFGARGDEVTLLTSPNQFHSTFLEMIKRAKRRILISSLYIGTEQADLVEAIKEALSANPQLRVGMILDYHRSTRLSESKSQPPSTAHLLLPLIEKFPDRCEVWLFRSPKLKGLMERIVPERFDEGWGTWHAKWYGVDDEVILSGANAASSYFTNRQDRYIHFKSHPSLLSYLTSLTRLFTHYSYLLTATPPLSANKQHILPLPSPPSTLKGFFGSAALIWPAWTIPPRAFEAHAHATITAFQKSWTAANNSRLRRVDVDTWFWPVIQAGVLSLKEEEQAMVKVWQAVQEAHEGDMPDGVEVDMTSGYFGLYKAYKQAIIESPAPVRVIAASPKANGFYGSKGLSRLIPEGYTLLESRFHRDATADGRQWEATTKKGVRLREWEREGWTYHAKGIWLSPTSPPLHHNPIQAGTKSPNTPTNPFMTFIGSSNLSTRSLELDTELSLLLMTSSPSLRRALNAEVQQLDKYASDVGEETWAKEERRVSKLARVLVALGVEGML